MNTSYQGLGHVKYLEMKPVVDSQTAVRYLKHPLGVKSKRKKTTADTRSRQYLMSLPLPLPLPIKLGKQLPQLRTIFHHGGQLARRHLSRASPNRSIPQINACIGRPVATYHREVSDFRVNTDMIGSGQAVTSLAGLERMEESRLKSVSFQSTDKGFDTLEAVGPAFFRFFRSPSSRPVCKGAGPMIQTKDFHTHPGHTGNTLLPRATLWWLTADLFNCCRRVQRMLGQLA